MNSAGTHLSKTEMEVLKELLSNDDSFFLEELRDEFCVRESCPEEKRTIVKCSYRIFGFDEDVFFEIYSGITDRTCKNLELEGGNIERGVSPVVVFYKEDTKSWYLEYYKKRSHHTVKLEKIKAVSDSDKEYEGHTGEYSGWRLNSKPVDVKLRIYDERGVMQSFMKESFGRKVHKIEHKDGHSEIAFTVEDIKILKVWIRSHTPAVLVLEPETLKKEMIKEAIALLGR